MPFCKYCGTCPFKTYCPSFMQHQKCCRAAHLRGIDIAKKEKQMISPSARMAIESLEHEKVSNAREKKGVTIRVNNNIPTPVVVNNYIFNGGNNQNYPHPPIAPYNGRYPMTPSIIKYTNDLMGISSNAVQNISHVNSIIAILYKADGEWIDACLKLGTGDDYYQTLAFLQDALEIVKGKIKGNTELSMYVDDIISELAFRERGVVY